VTVVSIGVSSVTVSNSASTPKSLKKLVASVTPNPVWFTKFVKASKYYVSSRVAPTSKSASFPPSFVAI
jgi:hypothetical protein